MTAVPGWLQPLVDLTTSADVAASMRFRLPALPEGTHRQAAVLVLFGETAGRGSDVLLIERASDLRAHAGQPAFPGGAVDPDDDGPVSAALREAREETGVDPVGVEVFGVLPALPLPVSSFVVTPVLAWWRTPGPVSPVDPAEVAAVHRVPLSDLVDPRHRLRIRHPSGWVGPAFEVAGMTVWGFTAGLLDRLIALAGWEQPWDLTRIEDLTTQDPLLDDESLADSQVDEGTA